MIRPTEGFDGSPLSPERQAGIDAQAEGFAMAAARRR